MKLATKLMILFLLLATIPLVVVGYLAYDNGRRTIEQNMLNHLISTNIYKEDEFERWVEGNGQQLRSLAGVPFFKDQFAAEIATHDLTDPEHQEVHRRIRADYLLPTLEEEGGFIDLFILRADDGLILVSTDETQEEKFREHEPYFVEGKSRTYVQNVYYSLTLGKAAMTIGTPIRDREGNLLAVLAGHLDLAEMSEIMMQRSGLSATEETYLVNKFNFFVTEPKPKFGQGYALKKALYTEGVQACLAHNSFDQAQDRDGVGFYDDYRGVPVIGSYRWMPERELCILTEVDQAEAFAPIVALRNAALGVGVAVALIAALVGIFFARSITGPVRQLVEGAEEFGRGNLEYHIAVKTKDEIGQLAGAFNEMAAKRKQAEQALDRRMAELNALNAMATIVTESLDVDEILNRATDEALRLVGVEAAAMLLLDEKAGELALVAHRGLSDEFVRTFSRMKLGEGLAGRVAQMGKPAVIGDLAEYPGALKAYVEKERIQSAASVPLVGHTGVIGVMNLGTASSHYFDAAGLGLLVALGRQIGIGVEKARLYAETRRRNRELSVLYEITRSTAESLDLEKTLNNAIEATLEALEIEVGGIYLMEPEGETLTLRVYRGVSDEVARNLQRVKLGEGMSGRAAAEKKPVVLDVQDYPSQRLAPYIVQERLQSLASTPLLSAGQRIGAMNLSTRRARAFPPEELELLTAIGQQLGSAVQNARLYEAIQRELAERKRAEQQLIERTAQLEVANKELEAFSYSVSHDLRAPLRALDGFSRILLEEYTAQLPAEARRYLGLVCDNTRQMGRLIDDLLTFSRLSRQPLNKQPVTMANIVQQALAELHAEQEGRRVEITIGDPSAGRRGEPVEPSGQALPACQADPALLKQVWVNLLSNALKFTRKREVARIEVGFSPHPSPPRPSPSLSQEEREGEGGAQRREGLGEVGAYFIRDNGVGFDMRYADKLFGVFQRLHRAEEYEGTGVGLATVQRIIHRHGGRAWAEAEVDKGATFYFTLGGGNQND